MSYLTSLPNKERAGDCATAVLLFLLAFIPRYIGLGQIIVADEQLWISRSKEFAKALLHLDLPGTARTGHPGVVTMWLGSASLGIQHVMRGSNNPTEQLFAAQLPTVLVTSIAIVILFFLVRKLCGAATATIASILIATDPFFLAFSRIIHLDALLTTFMCLAVLSFLLYLKDPGRLVYLLFSSLCTGLAVLAKVPGVFLFPFVALVLGMEFVHQVVYQKKAVLRAVGEQLRIYIIWSIGSLAVIFLCWPAMWSDPMVFVRLFTEVPGMVPHEHGQYFMGQPVDDPGALFYPAVILFRTTPLVLAFVVLSIGIIMSESFRAASRFDREAAIRVTLVCFAIFFTGFVSVVGKKMDRYVLPVFPILDILASIGIVWLADRFARRFAGQAVFRFWGFSLLVIILLIVQVLPVVKLYPYYAAHYNAFAGGPAKAKEVLLIGRGEGLDLVGEYLNKKENARELSVATEFDYLLRKYFRGEIRTLKIEDYEEGTLGEVDYLVIYVSGLQQERFRIPNEALEYHRTHSPEHTIRINGIEYAYIYNMRAGQHSAPARGDKRHDGRSERAGS